MVPHHIAWYPNFYLLFKFNIYKKSNNTNITYDYITFNNTNWVGTIPTKSISLSNQKEFYLNNKDNIRLINYASRKGQKYPLLFIVNQSKLCGTKVHVKMH